MSYSRIALLCFVLTFISACGPHRPIVISDSVAARETVSSLVRQEGHVSTPFTQAYFDYLMRRLVSALPPRAAEFKHLKVVILWNSPHQAGTPGNGYIVLSRPLIQALSNEGELAFVMAHELAHLVLGHTPADAKDTARHEDLEREADSYAVGLIALAGYDPRVATGALSKAAPLGALFDFGRSSQPGYPALEERVRLVQAMVAQSQWRPPGTIDRRDFQLMRREVMLAPPAAEFPLY